ncbi:MAG: hypothetical protein IKX33_09260 [Prevotella sp.]|nr:hypothetical protein [Prevotella sp.]
MKPICFFALFTFLIFTACQVKPSQEEMVEKLEIPKCIVTTMGVINGS